MPSSWSTLKVTESDIEAVSTFVLLVCSLLTWAYLQEAILTTAFPMDKDMMKMKRNDSETLHDENEAAASMDNAMQYKAETSDYFRYDLLLVLTNRMTSFIAAAAVVTSTQGLKVFRRPPVPVRLVAVSSLSNVLATSFQVSNAGDAYET